MLTMPKREFSDSSMVAKGTFLSAGVNLARDNSVVGAFLLLVVVFSCVNSNFFSLQAWQMTASQLPETLLLALGETFVIVSAGIDLSVGAVLGFSAMTSSLIMQYMFDHNQNSYLTMICGLLIALAVGTVWGALNGVLITRVRITPFIATLATYGMATGGGFIISRGATVTNMPPQLGTWINASLFGVFPVGFLVSFLLSILLSLILSRTRFGIRTYAIGSNLRAARVAGINVNRHLIMVYVLTGFLAGLDGILLSAKFVSANPFYGSNDELNAIAAVIVGGASLSGGRGGIFGTFIGALIIAIIPTGLIVMGFSSYWQMVGAGAIIILAVYLEKLRSRRTL